LLGEYGYPRPMLERDRWWSLNGPWEFALDPEASWKLPGDVQWNATINVPFAPETTASGIGDNSFYRACWYRRIVEVPEHASGERVLLHFGAVDYEATVWINDQLAGSHVGGHTPFTIELTQFIGDAPTANVVVRAYDDPHDLAKPRGKQDWMLEPHSIWYPRTTGIWQTVWLETVPTTSIARVGWTPNRERWEIGLEAYVDGVERDDLRLRVRLHVGDLLLADDTYAIVAGEVHRRIALSDPGIDDYRNELLWSPRSPTLIQAELQLWGRRGEMVDSVKSYTALRSIGIQGDRFVLNGRPWTMRLVLDQGYWPDTGLTAPDDDALRRDVELAKAMGFNGVRKHQKIEAPRYLYWADRLGLMVWEEMPSAYRYTKRSIERLINEWSEAIDRDRSHPCIVAWVPFNESWGVPDLPDNPAQRNYVQALYHLTKTLDPTRPVIGNDGWESLATDIIGIHDYDDEPEEIAARYASDEVLGRLFTRERPGGRLLTIEGHHHTGQPIVLSEFGGITYAPRAENEKIWGYTKTDDAAALAEQYAALMKVVRKIKMFAGFCYTQFADTYQEANGLLYVDRTPKFPLDQIANATRGEMTDRQRQIETEWRQRMQRFWETQHTPSLEPVGPAVE
jgi:beta-galactosidase/beta-glucuronidase